MNKSQANWQPPERSVLSVFLFERVFFKTTYCVVHNLHIHYLTYPLTFNNTNTHTCTLYARAETIFYMHAYTIQFKFTPTKRETRSCSVAPVSLCMRYTQSSIPSRSKALDVQKLEALACAGVCGRLVRHICGANINSNNNNTTTTPPHPQEKTGLPCVCLCCVYTI